MEAPYEAHKRPGGQDLSDDRERTVACLGARVDHRDRYAHEQERCRCRDDPSGGRDRAIVGGLAWRH